MDDAGGPRVDAGPVTDRPAVQNPTGVGRRPTVHDHVLHRRIGAGAYGEVWLARSVHGVWRAVKVVWRAQFEHERTYERELAGLRLFEPVSREHPGLVDILQVGHDPEGGCFYHVMELADDARDGGSDPGDPGYEPATLATLLARRGRLPVRECARLGAEMASALGFLHQHGLVHRDIKPANVIFVQGRPKLADIGLVTGARGARSFVGTDGYIPPEGPGTAAADLFSLGRVLYELATGKNRLDYPDLPAALVEEDADGEFAEFNEILLRAGAPEVGRRYATADEMRGDLLLVDGGRSVREMRCSQRMMARWRRGAVVAGFVGLAALAVVAGVRQQAVRAAAQARAERSQRERLEAQELRARQNLYAADMNLAQMALDAGNHGRAVELLGAHRPGPGEADLRGFEWHHLNDRSAGRTLAVFRGHGDVVSSLVPGDDPDRFVSAGFDGTVREWSIREVRQLRRWDLPGCAVMALARDPAGRHLAVEGGNRPMSAVLDLATGAWTSAVLSASPGVAFSPDGNRIVRGAEMLIFQTNGVVEVTDLRLGRLRVLPEAGGRVWWTPDGRRLITGSWGDALRVWTWPGLEPDGDLPGIGTVMTVTVSPDGSRLVCGTRDGRLELWDLDTRRRIRGLQAHQGGVIWSAAFSPGGDRVASAGNDQAVRIWDAATLTERQVHRGHASEVWSVLWTADGSRLLSSGKDGTIRLWDARPGPELPPLDQVAGRVVFDATERRMAVRQWGRGVTVWDLDTGSEVCALGEAVELGGFHEAGQLLDLLRPDGTWERWRLEDRVCVASRRFGMPDGEVTRRAMSPDGRWLVTGMADGAVWVADGEAGGSPVRLEAHSQMIVALEVSADGRRLVTGSIDRTARVWDLATREGRGEFVGHRMGVGSVAFSPDGVSVATGSWDDTVRIHSPRGGAVVLGGHASSVHDVAFAPDGRTLAAITGGGVLKLWSLAALREALVLDLGGGTGLGKVVFSPRGRWLAAVGPGGRLTLLRADRPPDVTTRP